MIRKYRFQGKVIDIGCGEKPFRPFFIHTEQYEGIDLKNYSENKDLCNGAPDYYFNEKYFNSWRLPFKDECYDTAVSFQVLEHHPNPQKMIEEMIRITKKGGYIMLSFPLIAGLHEKPNDFFRLTEYGLKEFLKKQKAEICEIRRQGSLFSTIAHLLCEYANNLAGRSRRAYWLVTLFYWPVLLFEYLALLLDKIVVSEDIFLNYLILAKKSSV